MDIISIACLTSLSLPVGPFEVLLVTNKGPHWTFAVGVIGRTLGCVVQYYYGYLIPTKRKLFCIPSNLPAVMAFKASPAPGFVCNMSLGYSKVSVSYFVISCILVNSLYSFLFCYGSYINLQIFKKIPI